MRLPRSTLPVLLALLGPVACADPESPDAGSGVDASATDSGTRDVGTDAGPTDSGRVDTGPEDTGADAAPSDLGPMDTGPTDGGPADSGALDASAPDATCSRPELQGTATAFFGPAPVAYYTFDDDHRAGATIIDVAGTGSADGTANAVATSLLGRPGQVGQSAGLDGVAAMISAPALGSNDLSAALWVRMNGWPVAEDKVILDQSHGPAAFQGWGFSIRPSGIVLAFVEGGVSAANEHVATSSSCVSAGQWAHLAMTFDGSFVRLYQNGVLQQETPTNLTTIDHGTHGLAIGFDSFAQSASFDGDVDEVAVFDQALSATQVGQIYLAGRDGLHFYCPGRCGQVTGPLVALPTNGLVAWYRADTAVQSGVDGLVCAWCDASGLGHDLVQPTAANKPRALPMGFGGVPSVEFPIVGAQYVARGGDLTITSTSGRTYFAVYRLLDAAARTNILYQGRSGTPGTYVEIDTNTFNSQTDSYAVYVTNNAYDSNIPTTTDPVIHTLRLNSMTVGLPVLSQVSGFVNNAPMTLTRTPGGLGNTLIEPFVPDFVAIGPSTGGAEISEALIYDRPLDETERQQVESYLAARYGIVLQ